MNIDHISESLGSQSAQKSYFDPKKRAETFRKEESQKVPTRSDAVSISEEAKKLRQKEALLETAGNEINALPETKMSRAEMQQIISKILGHHYFTKEVTEKIAEAMLEPDKVQPQQLEQGEAKPSINLNVISEDRLQEIRQKIADGFYDNPGIMEVIVKALFS